MAFQPGNKDQRRPKLCFDALMMELKDAEEPKTLRGIMRKLIDMAAEGDIQAIKEVMNRIDGLPVQIVENLNENINYVALMPPRNPDMDSWLTQYAQQKQIPTKQ